MAETELPDRWVKPATQTTLQDLGLLLLRVVPSALMITHGLPKWAGFAEKSAHFPDPLHVSSPISLALVIFAELICAGLVMLGLATRLASLVVVINFAVIVWIIDAGKDLGDKELAIFYLLVYAVLLLTGPGRFALDRMLKKALGKGDSKIGKAKISTRPLTDGELTAN